MDLIWLIPITAYLVFGSIMGLFWTCGAEYRKSPTRHLTFGLVALFWPFALLLLISRVSFAIILTTVLWVGSAQLARYFLSEDFWIPAAVAGLLLGIFISVKMLERG